MSSDDAIDMHTAQSFNMNRDDFLHQLYTFMNKRGQPISKVPSLGYQELDLFMLYKLVIERGGMDEVTRKQEWKIVYQDLGIPTMSTSASYNTRTNYKKYLYLYELEHCDFSDRNRPKDTEPKYQVGEHVRIISSVFEGQVFYAKILKYRYKDGKNQYYVHYNGWNSSHDEWMREDVLDPLLAEERRFPESLPNPPASRSSKSNHLIYDASISGKVLTTILNQQQSPVKVKATAQLQLLHPLSPVSPSKRGRKPSTSYIGYYGDTTSTSEEEEAASDLLEMTVIPQLRHNVSDSGPAVQRVPSGAAVARKRPVPAEFMDYPMRADVGLGIASIIQHKRDYLHEADIIHRNRVHTHMLIDRDELSSALGADRERELIEALLGAVKTSLVEPPAIPADRSLDEVAKRKTLHRSRSHTAKHDATADNRSLEDIQQSVTNLQSNLLALQNEFRHTMRALKRHHGVTSLPAIPLHGRKSVISTRRGERL